MFFFINNEGLYFTKMQASKAGGPVALPIVQAVNLLAWQ